MYENSSDDATLSSFVKDNLRVIIFTNPHVLLMLQIAKENFNPQYNQGCKKWQKIGSFSMYSYISKTHRYIVVALIWNVTLHIRNYFNGWNFFDHKHLNLKVV